MATFAFSGGVVALPAYGERQKVRFVGTWANGDTWAIPGVATLAGDFTLGKGNIAGNTFANGFVFRDRVYVSFADNFAFSSNADPTLWEEQNPGAAVINFNSQYGQQDSVKGFATMQGRLAVFGEKSIQLWQTDADPANFALQQALDNSGTFASASIQSLGDADVLYLDSTGIRSLRTKELTLNAEVSDIGTPVDSLVRTDILTDNSVVCSVVEPLYKQYWLYINDKIYVLSRYSASKVLAWSTFVPDSEDYVFAYPYGYYQVDGANGILTYSLTVGNTYSWTKGANETSLTNGATVLTDSGSFTATVATTDIRGPSSGVPPTFVLRMTAIAGSSLKPRKELTPVKMLVHNEMVYIYAAQNFVYRYGASTLGASYDYVQPVIELPWNSMQMPSIKKQIKGFDLALSGKWQVSGGTDPLSVATLPVIATLGQDSASPAMDVDSTYDVGHVPWSANGTHFKLRFLGDPSQELNTVYKLGFVSVLYDPANVK